MNENIFANRAEAGQKLALEIAAQGCAGNSLILALPRGGLPVAHEIASRLELPLDVLAVRKLGVPMHKEVAMGAIAQGGVYCLNTAIIKAYRVDSYALTKTITDESRELERREKLYRGNQPMPRLVGREVIIVDDGLATGATMRAAVTFLRRQGVGRVKIAIPVAAPLALFESRSLVDSVICLETPEAFQAVSLWYRDFTQTSDAEVMQILQEHWAAAVMDV